MSDKYIVRRFHNSDANEVSELIIKTLRTTNIKDYSEEYIENDVKLFILCNPHNPVGRVWTEEELKRTLDICKKHHVYVIADEIHQDLIMKGYKKVTAATVGDYDDMLITLTAATKTFNLASVDTVYITKEVYRNASLSTLNSQHSTKTDTVRVTEYRDRVVEKPPEKYIPKFYKNCTWLFFILLLLLVGIIVFKVWRWFLIKRSSS